MAFDVKGCACLLDFDGAFSPLSLSLVSVPSTAGRWNRPCKCDAGGAETGASNAVPDSSLWYGELSLSRAPPPAPLPNFG